MPSWLIWIGERPKRSATNTRETQKTIQRVIGIKRFMLKFNDGAVPVDGDGVFGFNHDAFAKVHVFNLGNERAKSSLEAFSRGKD